MRLKRTYIYAGKVKTFDQYAEGESRDEFRARATCALNMPEGAEYYAFEQHGYPYRGPVGDSCPGHKRIYRRYAQDDMLPGLFVFGRVREELRIELPKARK